MGLGLCRLSWYLDEATLAISSLLVAFYTVVRWKIIIFPLSAKTDSWTGVILPILLIWAVPFSYLVAADFMAEIFEVDKFRATPWPSCSLSDDDPKQSANMWMITTAIFFLLPLIIFLIFAIATMISLKKRNFRFREISTWQHSERTSIIRLFGVMSSYVIGYFPLALYYAISSYKDGR